MNRTTAARIAVLILRERPQHFNRIIACREH